MESFENLSIEGVYDRDFELDLNSTYSLCNSEMGLQQSKRDQIIAFYIAIISFLVPAIIDLELPFLPQAVAYFLLWVIGISLCSVVRRYRVYKEVYWLTLRTISTMMRAKKGTLREAMIKRLFRETMTVMQPKTVVIKAGAQPENWVDLEKTRKLNSRSAEFLLYRLLSVMSSVVLLIAGYTFVYGLLEYFQVPRFEEYGILPAILIAVVPAGISHCRCINAFVRELAAVYQYCYDRNLDSFEKAFAKAWFLHCSINEPDKEVNPEETVEQEPTVQKGHP